MYTLAKAELVLLLGFVAGFAQHLTYGAVLLLHAISTFHAVDGQGEGMVSFGPLRQAYEWSRPGPTGAHPGITLSSGSASNGRRPPAWGLGFKVPRSRRYDASAFQ